MTANFKGKSVLQPVGSVGKICFLTPFNRYRRLIKPDTPVEISLFIPENYIGGFPHLYKSMLSNDQFKIEISDSLDECAEYLSVDKKLLEDAVK